MPEAKLCHLPLGFNTLHKLNPFYDFDIANCSIFSSINTGLIVVLACSHTYHKICYNNSRFKCLYCLSYLQEDVNVHVQSLLTRLQQFNEIQVEKDDNNIPYDNDDKNESVECMTFILEENFNHNNI
ncbi:17084_t:CDS:1 [Funneliformis caledonium]|uniref:17084_t:CDS:1 n=1 Tax=Funneliformis caledonium TaxID=1117310 RepID=A0A9N9AII1_9GLOM|nr:17084_t:CDS:1 [Funneliformis caledonium]